MAVEAFIRSIMIVDTKIGEFLLNRDVEDLTLKGVINLARNTSDWFTQVEKFKATNKPNASVNKNFRDTNVHTPAVHSIPFRTKFDPAPHFQHWTSQANNNMPYRPQSQLFILFIR
ncbi:hypothetical protein QE152_g30052 [Popillia japonica]|uniref:Uncharacterized protein n=1 Tax=Popillia japonica TaxID=7064 RepID=A0AAW1JFY4_POPJA